MSMQVGILAVQGDVHENILSAKQALDEMGVSGSVLPVSTATEISSLDCLIIPGGESTTMGQLSLTNGSLKAISDKIRDGMPVLGICAGMIMLSSSVADRVTGDTGQPLLEALDVKLERNSFGRQNDSFEAKVSMESIGISDFYGVFIRAPSISSVASDVQVLSTLEGKIIAVKKGKIIGTAFHPELTGDTSVHKYLISLVDSGS